MYICIYMRRTLACESRIAANGPARFLKSAPNCTEDGVYWGWRGWGWHLCITDVTSDLRDPLVHSEKCYVAEESEPD